MRVSLALIFVALGVHWDDLNLLEQYIIQRASNPRCIVTFVGNFKCIICLLVELYALCELPIVAYVVLIYTNVIEQYGVTFVTLQCLKTSCICLKS